MNYYAAFKAQENRRFSVSYTMLHFIGDKILAPYTHEAYKKNSVFVETQQKMHKSKDLLHLQNLREKIEINVKLYQSFNS